MYSAIDLISDAFIIHQQPVAVVGGKDRREVSLRSVHIKNNNTKTRFRQSSVTGTMFLKKRVEWQKFGWQ